MNELAKELAITYYNLVIGLFPTTNTLEQTIKTIGTLIDNKFSSSEIIKILISIGKVDKITPNDLPEYLWENSLTKKGVFYYHSELHITSNPPKWDPITMKEVTEPYFMEMKINYTINDLLNYYYKTLKIPIELRDEKKDIGGLTFLLDKYKKMKVEPIDFVLTLIDTANTSSTKQIINVLSISEFEVDVYNTFEVIVPTATIEKANMIVWR